MLLQLVQVLEQLTHLEIEKIDPRIAFEEFKEDRITGYEPCLGGELREKAVWVDNEVCIGCQYCVHVASNTFVVEEEYGYSRAIRQDGDSIELISEAIDTCPVDCIHWVSFEDPRR